MTAVETSVEYEGKAFPVSFASDDSIDVVRQRIGAVLDRHPDRLFLEIEVKLPRDYYKDPRRWETLYFRLAHQSNATTTTGKLMAIYTRGKMETGVSRDDWDSAAMKWLRLREEAFPERFILGVEESQSLVLPTPPDSMIAVAVPASRVPLPEGSRIVSSIHPHPILRLYATEIQESAEQSIKNVYVPRLRTGTPDRLSVDSIQALDRQYTHWKKLMALKAPEPSGVHITRARWNIPWIHTQWSVSTRAQFEDILYGMSVSEEVPYIGLFQNREIGMQHKFYAKNRETHLDLPTWSAWIQATRPQRNRPTLLLYRGDDRSNFDRIAVTSAGMVVSIYRSGSSKKQTLESIQKSILDSWISKLDALLAFVDQEDFQTWELQDVSAELTYKDPMDDPNLLRLPCVSNVFVQTHPVYRLLRADKTDRSLTDLDVGILHVLRKDIAATPEQLGETLGVRADDVAARLTDLRDRIEQDPSLLTQELDVMPKLEFGSTKVLLQHSIDLDRIVSYANLLRFVLTGSSGALSEVCPERRGVAAPVVAVAPVVPVPEEAPVPEEDLEGDLADFLEQMGAAKKEAPNPLFNYYTTRLRSVDADTFDTPYSKKCEPSRQILLMSPADQAKWKDTPYDPAAYPDTERLGIPSGVALCPDYWCMKDEIPLRADQLKDNRCPVCNGKVRDAKSTESIQAAPVIQRSTEYKYPRFLDIVSSKNGQRMPCCYKQPKASRVLPAPVSADAAPADPFYILGESKKLPALRVAYLPEELAKRLRLNIANYATFRADGNRLKDKARGVFRIGLGRPSKTLATALNLDIPRPRDAILKLFECPFVRTWRSPREDDGTFANALLPYLPDPTARERMARLLAGVDHAYHEGTLTQLQELEYVSLVTGTPVYRIDTQTMAVSCGLWTQYFGRGKTAIAVLESESAIDLLGFGTHRASLQVDANLYAAPFLDATIRVLRQADTKACATPFPSFQDALGAALRIGVVPNSPVVIDPTGLAQAIWAPNAYILPIRPDHLPDERTQKVAYSDMKDEQLPSYDQERKALDIAATINPQFAWKRDIYDVSGQRVEVELVCGLRAPVIPETIEPAGDPEDLVPTLRKGKEADLVYGSPDTKDAEKAAEISYTAEVFDFLLFTISRDLQTDDWAHLREAVASVDWDTLEEPLEEWYDSVVMATPIESPAQFVSKVRTPCGQLKQAQCKGICGWKNGCKVKVDSRVKQEGQKPESSRLFTRLLDTLIRNAKLRAMVLDGRASPFFSTILYLELPHERFMSDAQIKWEKTQSTE